MSGSPLQVGGFTLPSQLDEFQIERPLGRGANGQVFLAKDTVLERSVALKFLGGRRMSQNSQRRFLIEARAIARLKHPNVVTVYRFGETQGRPYLVSEYVSGQTLARLIKPIPWQKALSIGVELSRGLSAAHEQGVLHRDIKPSNVMISDESQVKLLDFGLAKLSGLLGDSVGDAGAESLKDVSADRVEGIDESLDHTVDPARSTPDAAGEPARAETLPVQPRSGKAKGRSKPRGKPSPKREPLTRIGAVIGTPAYMAPEAWQGLPATPMTDVYSLGAVLYELCTGHPPHHHEDVQEIERGALYDDIPPLSEVVPGIDGRFSLLVARCLARDPAARPQSGTEVKDSLEALLRPTLAALILRALRQHWSFALLALMLLVGLSVGSTYLLAQRAAQRMEHPILRARLVVAVLGLVPDAGGETDSAYATAISDLIGRRLSLGERVRVVASASVQQMLQESGIRESAAYDAATLQQIGKRLDTAVTITGSYLLRDEGKRRLRLSLMAQDTATGKTLAQSVTEGDASDVFGLVGSAAVVLRQGLGLGEIPMKTKSGLDVAKPESLRRYGEALQLFRVFQLRPAAELLTRLTSDDPDFSPAYATLASVWRSLGYDVKARKVLAKAIEHTSGLGREERLLIEAEYRESLKDWEQAYTTYGTLTRLFPDNPEYPLALAEAQLNAGNVDDALRTLQKIQKERLGTQADPRVDAALARTLEDKGDFPAAHARYQAAIDKSRAIGAVVLAARCMVSQAYIKKFLGESQAILPNLDLAIDIFRRAGAQLDAADALAGKAWILRDRGDAQQALATLEESVSILIEAGSGNATAIHLGNLAILLLKTGDLKLSAARAEASLILSREVDGKEAYVAALLALSGVELQKLQLASAEARVDQADLVLRDAGHGLVRAWSSSLRGELAMMRGQLDQAKRKHEEALAQRTQLDSRGFAAESHASLAQVALLSSSPREAIEHAERAVPLFRVDGQRDGEAWATAILGAAHAALRHKEEAIALAKQVEVLSQDCPYPPMRASILSMLSRLYSELALIKESADCANQIERLLTDPKLAELRRIRIDLKLAKARIQHRYTQTPQIRQTLLAIQSEADAAGFLQIRHEVETMLSE